jgi:phospholipid/cholesterol/gamma-HCH transport system substrate-binding protein
MQEGRRSLIDISLAAQKVTRKFDPRTGAAAPAPARKPQKRQ